MNTTTTKTKTTKVLDLKSIDQAPQASRPHLEKAKEKFGFVPNLYKLFANSPAALDAYVGLSGTLSKHATLSPAEQQLVMLTISRDNECHYCVAAHSTVAGQFGLSDDAIQAIRDDRSLDDPKLEALRRFAKSVVAERGWLSDDKVREFVDAGYSKEQILEVFVITAMKTLSNYTNHLAETPLDDAFEAKSWKKTG